ncbi:MAG: sensor histidine kinase, partial [Candidatus Thorarchaeota archaeon]
LYGDPETWIPMSNPAIEQIQFASMEELRSRCKELQAALDEQRREISSHLHSLAHDVRGALSGVVGYAELMKIERRPEYVEAIVQTAHRVMRMLSRSLQQVDSACYSVSCETTDLNKIVLDLVASIISPETQFSVDSLPTVTGDLEKLGRVFQNLFLNAIEHGDARRIEVRAEQTEEGVDLVVRNNGHPISPHVRSKLFHSRISSKPDGGYGLSIVNGIIRAHKWEISLDACEFTAFRIHIPNDAIVAL